MKNPSINNIAGLTLVATLSVSGSVSAEQFGLLNGRSADLGQAPENSVEGGVGFGEFDDVDYEYYGARFNYKFNPTTVVYADAGQADIDTGNEADGITFGVGGYWQLNGIFSGSDFAVHASIHHVDLDFKRFDNGIKGNTLVVEGLFSSKKPANEAGTLYLNGSVGLARADLDVTEVNSDNSADTELTFSAGAVLKTQSKAGEFFGGIFYVDDLGFGAGYRHFLK